MKETIEHWIDCASRAGGPCDCGGYTELHDSDGDDGE